MLTAYSTHGQLNPRLILAEGFWVGLIQAAAYLRRESTRINALKHCPRLAEAENDCCACSAFNYTQTFKAERRALQWRENEFCSHLCPLKSGKWQRRRIEIHLKKETYGEPLRKSKSCCRIGRRSFRTSFAIFFDKLIIWEPDTNLDLRDSVKWKEKPWKIQRFLLARATVAITRSKRSYPKTRHQSKLRHHWNDLAAN